MEIETTVEGFVVGELMRGNGEVTRETSLFQKGVLDSMSLAELIAFLEETFQIKVRASEVTFDNLDSVNKVSAFVRSKIPA
jgi:acyl carrier protein